LDVPDAFKLYIKEIDKDKSGTISAQEFVKLLMVRRKKIYLAST
jgi:Ca2+-binding EF-hand superfamily protein